MTSQQKPVVIWNNPETVPNVKIGEEELCWIAVESDGKVFTFSAYYQNRPLITNEDGDLINGCDDWALSNEWDGYIDSVCWVHNRLHTDYDHCWEQIKFDNEYKLLGWAKYETPEFTGVKV